MITLSDKEALFSTTYNTLSFLANEPHNLHEQLLSRISDVITQHLPLMKAHPESYKGAGLKIRKEKNQKEPTKTLWFHLCEEHQMARVQICLKPLPSGKGGFKSAKRAVTFIAIIDHGRLVKMYTEPTAWIRTLKPKNKRSDKEYRNKLEMVRNGLKTINELFPREVREKDPNLRFAGIPDVVRESNKTYGDGYKITKLQWEEILFDGTFSDVHSILDDSTQGPIYLPIVDMLRIFDNFLYSVDQLHSKGYVFADVKTNNILIKKANWEGWIKDYDLLCPIGTRTSRNNFEFWDLFYQEGLILPTADIIGLSISLGCAIFGRRYAAKLQTLRVDKKESPICDFLENCRKEYVGKKISLMLEELNLPSEWDSKLQPIINQATVLSPSAFEVFTEVSRVDFRKRELVLHTFADCFVVEKLSSILAELHVDEIRFFQSWQQEKYNDTLSHEEKYGIIQELYREFPAFSHFRTRLQGLHSVWQNTVQEGFPLSSDSPGWWKRKADWILPKSFLSNY